MEDKLIKDYFKILKGKKEKEVKFCVLQNKQSRRSIIFQRNNRNAIEFMKNKSSSSIKKVGYFLIRLRILQIFLKKIKLDPSIGQLVFFGGQTKIFDFNRGTVTSFMRGLGWEKSFIKDKREQKRLSKKGFAPKILKINEKIPFCVEELLKGGSKIAEEDTFRKLIKYYETQRKKKILYSSYINKMEKKKTFNELPSFLKEELKKIKAKRSFFYVLKIHGDFGKDQILLRGNEILFTDWQIREDLILADLFNFFREKENLLRNREFQYILKMFPKEVSENVKDYFIVSQSNLFLSSYISFKELIERTKSLSFAPNK